MISGYFSYVGSHGRRPSTTKVAMVGDKAWEKWMATICKPFTMSSIKYFDAGDVQANGFQIVEDDRPGETYTESGASYMGFAVSALLASAIADEGRYAVAFAGDTDASGADFVGIPAVDTTARIDGNTVSIDTFHRGWTVDDAAFSTVGSGITLLWPRFPQCPFGAGHAE